MKRRRKLDAFHYHEALDRAALLGEIVENALLDHPVLKKHRQARGLLLEASEKLGDLYQMLGQLADEAD